jgi:hypothetical protein
MELMQTLDDAWNSQDLGTFNQRHKPEVVVRWPGRAPTHGRHDQKAKARALTTLPDQHLDNRPYRVFFASGDRTCSIAHFSGTMTGRCDWQSRFVVPVCALRRPPAGSRRGLPAGSARLSTGGGAAVQHERPCEAAERHGAGDGANDIPGDPAGLVEGSADGAEIGDAVGVTGGLDVVVERHVDRDRDDEHRQVEDDRRDDPGQRRAAGRRQAQAITRG